MASLSNYAENLVADHLFRTATWAKPTALYFALFTAAPTDAGGGTEVTGGSYARVALAPLDTNYTGTHGTTTGASSGTAGEVTNAVTITFPTPSANWGTVTHIGVFDASTAGNMWVHGALTSSKTINSADPTPTFAVGDFSVTFA